MGGMLGSLLPGLGSMMGGSGTPDPMAGLNRMMEPRTDKKHPVGTPMNPNIQDGEYDPRNQKKPNKLSSMFSNLGKNRTAAPEIPQTAGIDAQGLLASLFGHY